jgi:hypothetical protein
MARAARVLTMSSALVLVACNAVLGLRDIQEGAPDIDASSPSGALDGGGGTDGSSPTDSSIGALDGDGARDAASGFCAAYPTAIVCDDFESGQFSKLWQPVKLGTAFSRIDGRSDAVDGGPNQLVGTLGFSPIPSSGVSAVGIEMAAGRRSLRFEVHTRLNGWYSGVEVARMIDATGKGLHVLANQVAGTSQWKYAVHTDVSDGGTMHVVDIGFLVADLWTCLEVEVAMDGTLRVWQGPSLTVASVSPTLATTPLQAQIGMVWNYFANGGSKDTQYDNVVVGTGAVGCQ